MPLLLLVVGLSLIAFTLFDALWTTIAPHGAGPLSKRIARGWWTASLWVHRRRAGGAHGLLAFAGPALLVVAFLVWVGLLWAGWTLLFSAEPGAVVGSSSNESADLAGRVYYVGFVLFTLGTGDYVPVGGTWEVLSALASLSGLFVVTLAITYVLSVVSAVAAKRRLAGSIHSLGETPSDVVRRAWDGSGFAGLDQHLPSLGSALEYHDQRHAAYPILHYFHSTERRTALGPAVAVLDDALLILAEGVAPDARPAPAIVEPTRRSVGSFLDTLGDAFIEPSDDVPPTPDLAVVASAGIPTEAAGDFKRAVERGAHRRRLLRGLVEDGGWSWTAVVSARPGAQ
ncbi:MAG: two pore domain potassium channel family protein [Rhodothermales bacterium]